MADRRGTGMSFLGRLIIERVFLFYKGMMKQNVRAGDPAAPGGTFLPLLPFGPDGIRRAPPRRTHPDGGEDTRSIKGCQHLLISENKAPQTTNRYKSPADTCGTFGLR
jgi:hypothetical protein